MQTWSKPGCYKHYPTHSWVTASLNVHDVYFVINHGVALKAKAPPLIWLCMFRQWGWLPMLYHAIRHIIVQHHVNTHIN